MTQYESFEEKLEKTKFENKEELFEDFFERYAKKNLDEIGKQLDRNVNYFISYHIEKDEYKSGVMASDNWESQPETANKIIKVFNKSQNSIRNIRNEETISNLDYIANEHCPDQYADEFYPEIKKWKEDLREANIYLEGTEEKMNELLENEDFKKFKNKLDIVAELVVLHSFDQQELNKKLKGFCPFINY